YVGNPYPEKGPKYNLKLSDQLAVRPKPNGLGTGTYLVESLVELDYTKRTLRRHDNVVEVVATGPNKYRVVHFPGTPMPLQPTMQQPPPPQPMLLQQQLQATPGQQQQLMM